MIIKVIPNSPGYMLVGGENYSEVTATYLKYCRRNRLIVHYNGAGAFKWGFFIGFIIWKMHLIEVSHIASHFSFQKKKKKNPCVLRNTLIRES